MRLEKVYALRRVVMKREVTLVPARTDLGLKVTVTLATVSSLFFYYDNDNVNDSVEDNSDECNKLPMQSSFYFIIFDEQISLDKKDYS